MPYKAQIMVLKDELAKIFMNSDRRKKLFPELQPGMQEEKLLLQHFVHT